MFMYIYIFRWYHMCFTYDNSKSLHTTYLNGKEVFSVVKNIGRSMYGDTAIIGQGEFKQNSLSAEITQVS